MLDKVLAGGRALTRVVVHQPHFLPWPPYLQRLAAADAFVCLDQVRFRKGYFHNRAVVFNPNGGTRLLVLPVRVSPDNSIAGAMAADRRSAIRCRNMLLDSYARFDQGLGLLEELGDTIRNANGSLADLNIRLLEIAFAYLGRPAPTIIRASSLDVPAERTDMIVACCRAAHADRLLIGWGAMTSTHDIQRIASAGIKIERQSPDLALTPLGPAADGVSLVDYVCRRKDVDVGSYLTRGVFMPLEKA